jgi:hypothetical protein
MVAMARAVPLWAQFEASVDQFFDSVHDNCDMVQLSRHLAPLLKKLDGFLRIKVFGRYIFRRCWGGGQF